MDEEALAEIEKRLERVSGLPWRLSRPEGMYIVGADNPGPLSLAAENWANREFAVHAPEDVRRLVAEVRLLRSLAEDCDRYAAGEAAGRLAALKWATKDREPDADAFGNWPAAWNWRLENGPAGSALPPHLFALLEGGKEIHVSFGSGTRVTRRDYGSREEAMADLAQALVRLARKGFPEEGKP